MSESKNNEGQGSGSNNSGGNNSPKKPFNFYWIYGIIVVILLALSLFSWQSGTKETNPQEFLEMAQEGDVRKIVIYNEEIAEVHLTKEALQDDKYPELDESLVKGPNTGPHFHFNIGPPETFQKKLDKVQESHNIAVSYQKRSNWGQELLQWLIFIGIMVALWVFLMKRLSGNSGPGGQIFNIGKSKAKVFEKGQTTNIHFGDVAGLAEAKEEVQEIVDFLKHPKKYTELGAKIPKGALLVGEPGTGKTLLAKAVAGEANVPFFSISGSDFVEMFVGVGASRVRDLFKQAKEKAPAIIFIDEIDAIGRARGRGPSMGGNDERENTLNQLLSEMDGFDTNSGVILMAASNRAEVLDKALLRPGRFDRQIAVDMPDLKEREQIFQVHLKELKIQEDVDVSTLARQTPGFSGADLANICNEAALTAARNKKKKIDMDDFSNAVDRVIAGLEKKNKIISPKEKKVIAYHEAGHATVSWLVEHASPLVKVSVVPRGQTLGAAWYLPEERQITTAEQIMDELCAALGGRAAEEVIFNKISTGALNDLEKVTKQAYAVVSMYGLNDRIGNRSYFDSTGQQNQFTKPYSEKTAEEIDEEVSKIIEENYNRAKNILEENKEKLTQLAEQLLENEVIFKEDLEKIFGKKQKPADEEPTWTNTVDAESEEVSLTGYANSIQNKKGSGTDDQEGGEENDGTDTGSTTGSTPNS